MAKYETIPVTVDAIQFTSEADVARIVEMVGGDKVSWNGVELIVRVEGAWHLVLPTEWVVSDPIFTYPYMMEDAEFHKAFRSA